MTMLITRRASLLGLAGVVLVSAASCSSVAGSTAHAGHSTSEAATGALIMAHGGGAVWNAEVEAMLAPLSKEHPIEIAFGMAEAASLQSGVKRLEARGVQRIAVVRLFISGESWYERTEQILGLVPGAEPQSGEHAGHGEHASHGSSGGGGGHSMALWRIETKSSFALSKQGLSEAPEMSEVLVERARGLSKDPSRESVLIIGHGPEDDGENQRWLTMIDQRAEAMRRLAPFKRVQVETLREDWPDKRVVSEARIRSFVEQAGQDNGRVLVIPYRVSGFGPYANVLKGLSYEADQKGLLPSAGVEHWVRRQIKELSAGPFRAPQQHAHGV
ncbi:MAG: CbiX/SirB N-terminal domain-containing protein [Hyphomonadaceae bacterium]|nr:CbiX/SirB N-terminal domain-containing protein [Hyphomonadaceae bacterium]